MRISTEMSDYIKQKVEEISPSAKIYLFGSRADDTSKGGDIDILIISGEKIAYMDKAKIRTGFYGRFGEQKLEIVNFLFDEQDPFKDIALEDAFEL